MAKKYINLNYIPTPKPLNGDGGTDVNDSDDGTRCRVTLGKPSMPETVNRGIQITVIDHSRSSDSSNGGGFLNRRFKR